MNFTKRQKHKVDISIHRETIYQNVFYGNDFTTKTRKHSAFHLVKSGIKGIGKIVVAPFVFLATAAFSFVRPKGKNVPFTEEDAVPFVSSHRLRKEKKTGILFSVGQTAPVPGSISCGYHYVRKKGLTVTG